MEALEGRSDVEETSVISATEEPLGLSQDCVAQLAHKITWVSNKKIMKN